MDKLREQFIRFDNAFYMGMDVPPNHKTLEIPILGLRFVDSNVQNRYEYYQASYAQAISEFDQVGYEYHKMEPTKGTWLGKLSYDRPSQLSVDGGYISNVTPLYTRKDK